MKDRIYSITKTTALITFAFFTVTVFSQPDSLSLNECQELAQKNYPLYKSYDLIKQSGEYSVSNARTGYLPAISINGQYTTQSDVTSLPLELPNIQIPKIKKEQYKIYAEVNQAIYDGGNTKVKRMAAESQTMIEEESLNIDLYKIRERINEIYFGILLIDKQIAQTDLLKKDINAGLEKMEAAFKNGTVLKSNVDAVKAESIKTDQRLIDLKAARKAYISMLSIFLNKTLDYQTGLKIPATIKINDDITRPELDLFRARMHNIDIQTSMVSSKNLPRVNLFAQAGYGSPALNMLNPDADTWYLAGVRFTYPLNGFYTMKREKAINELSKRNIELQRDAFMFNTKLQTSRQQIEIEKISQLISSDNQIVELRESVKKASLAQLENGVITSSDYLREVIAADQAHQTKSMHEIQLLLAIYNHQLITGNK